MNDKKYLDYEGLMTMLYSNEATRTLTLDEITLFVNSQWSFDSQKNRYVPSYWVYPGDIDAILSHVTYDRLTNIILAFEYLPPMTQGGQIPAQTGIVGHFEKGNILIYYHNNAGNTSLPLIIQTDTTIDDEGTGAQYIIFCQWDATQLRVVDDGNNNPIYLEEMISSGGEGGGGSISPASSEDIEMLMFNYKDSSSNSFYLEDLGEGLTAVRTKFNAWNDRDFEQV